MWIILLVLCPMCMVEVEMILPPSFLTEEEMKEAPSEDLWCEIADCMFFPNTTEYVNQLNSELQRRASISF